ncbi:hypothetical protein V8E36_000410 [Tilletia maclaganii]
MASTDPSGSANQLDSAGRSATPMNRNNPAFLNKLRSMLDDKNNEDLIKWAPDGKSFFVPNHIRFGDTLLPRYFKHRNFSSFVRQLNMYGFHKVPHLQQGALDADKAAQSELWEFTNELFTRDEPELTAQVQRKKAVKSAAPGGAEGLAGFGAIPPNRLLLADMPFSATGEGLEHAGLPIDGAASGSTAGPSSSSSSSSASAQNLHLHPLFPALQAITVAQTNINSELSRLRSSNDDLWREAIDTRQRLKKQQDTVNKVIRFLAGVFGGRALANVATDEEGAGTPGPNGAKDAGPSSSGSSRVDSASVLGSARRVAIYRPSTTANGRLLIGDGTEVVLESGASSSKLASGRRTSGSKREDEPQAEIFELPEIEEVQGDDASRFIETISPSESPPGGSSLKLQSPSLGSESSARPEPFRKSSSSIRKSITNTPTPVPGAAESGNPASSGSSGASGSNVDPNAASSWLASLLGQGAGAGSSVDYATSVAGNAVAAGGGLNSATQLDPAAMSALQSLFNSTGASPVRNSVSAPGGGGAAATTGFFGLGNSAGAGTGAGAVSSAPAISTALSLAPTLAGSFANSNILPAGLSVNPALWPTLSTGPASSSSNAMVLPSSSSLASFSDAGTTLAPTSGTFGSAPVSASNAGLSSTATQMMAANPELSRFTADLGQNHDDIQRVNSYLQALIDGVMQQQGTDADGSALPVSGAIGTGPPSNGLNGNLNDDGFGASLRASNEPSPIGGSGNADLDALLQEFLNPIAASGAGSGATPGGLGRTTPSPRPSFGTVDANRRISGGGGAGSGKQGGSGSFFPTAQTLALPGMSYGVSKESPLWAGDDDEEDDEDEDELDDEQDQSTNGVSADLSSSAVAGRKRKGVDGEQGSPGSEALAAKRTKFE